MGLPDELAFVFGDTASVFQRVRLISREMIAENTLALTIERPEGFTFEAGQNTTISLPGKHADDLRDFTIASAPHEKDLLLAMRVRNSAFKNACYALKPGDIISMRTPAGTLWQPTTLSQVWLSGGIGITPFRSIIRHILHSRMPLSVTHIHSDRSRTSAPFLAEFESYVLQEKGFDFHLVTTRESGPNKVRGRISDKMISNEIPNYSNRCYFLAGTDSFVASMREALNQLGIPSENVRTERFDGYKHN